MYATSYDMNNLQEIMKHRIFVAFHSRKITISFLSIISLIAVYWTQRNECYLLKSESKSTVKWKSWVLLICTSEVLRF